MINGRPTFENVPKGCFSKAFFLCGEGQSNKSAGNPKCCFVVVAHILRALLYVGMGERETIAFVAEAEEEEEEGETAAEWVTRVKQKKGGREGLYVRLVRFPPIIKNIFRQNLDECGNWTFKAFMKSCSLGQSLLLPSPLHKGPPPPDTEEGLYGRSVGRSPHITLPHAKQKKIGRHISGFFLSSPRGKLLSRVAPKEHKFQSLFYTGNFFPGNNGTFVLSVFLPPIRKATF